MPTLPPGIRARLVVPPVWICFVPVVEDKLITAESPLRFRLGFLIVAVPDVAPRFSEVADPAKFTVVAVVLTRSKVVEPVVRLVVIVGVAIVGEVPNTATPVPVSSVREAARLALVPVVARFEEASVKRARDAARPGNVIAPALPIVNLVVPAVEKAKVSAEELNIPVFKSPMKE
jgi:hypothetical protein